MTFFKDFIGDNYEIGLQKHLKQAEFEYFKTVFEKKLFRAVHKIIQNEQIKYNFTFNIELKFESEKCYFLTISILKNNPDYSKINWIYNIDYQTFNFKTVEEISQLISSTILDKISKCENNF